MANVVRSIFCHHFDHVPPYHWAIRYFKLTFLSCKTLFYFFFPAVHRCFVFSFGCLFSILLRRSQTLHWSGSAFRIHGSWTFSSCVSEGLATGLSIPFDPPSSWESLFTVDVGILLHVLDGIWFLDLPPSWPVLHVSEVFSAATGDTLYASKTSIFNLCKLLSTCFHILVSSLMNDQCFEQGSNSTASRDFFLQQCESWAPSSVGLENRRNSESSNFEWNSFFFFYLKEALWLFPWCHYCKFCECVPQSTSIFLTFYSGYLMF